MSCVDLLLWSLLEMILRCFEQQAHGCLPEKAVCGARGRAGMPRKSPASSNLLLLLSSHLDVYLLRWSPTALLPIAAHLPGSILSSLGEPYIQNSGSLLSSLEAYEE